MFSGAPLIGEYVEFRTTIELDEIKEEEQTENSEYFPGREKRKEK